MKIVRFFVVALIAACFALPSFGGFATQEDVDRVYAIPIDPFLFAIYLDKEYTMYGMIQTGDTIWTPGYVDWDEKSQSFSMAPGVGTTTSKYMEILAWAVFDDDESIDYFIDSVQATAPKVYDEMEGIEVSIYPNSAIKDVFQKVFELNKATYLEATTEFFNKVSEWYRKQTKKDGEKQSGGGGGGGGGGGKEATTGEAAEKIREAVDGLPESAAKSAQEVKKEVSSAEMKLKEAAAEAAKYDAATQQKSYEAVERAMQSFVGGKSTLESAINKGDVEQLKEARSHFANAKASIMEAQSILSQIEAPGYDSAREGLREIADKFTSISSLLNEAIDEADFSKARSALGLAQSLDEDFAQLKKKMRHGEIMALSALGEKLKAQDRLHLLLSLAAAYGDVSAQLESLKNQMYAMIDRYLTDMNTVGAYLGSTNAMAFVASGKRFKDLSADEIDRWFKFSKPENIDDALAFSQFNVDGSFFNTILHFLQTGYFPTAIPFNAGEKLIDHFNMPRIEFDNQRGFYEMPEEPLSSNITNWYAAKITAPANWADGSTITVTNGHFVARGAMSVSSQTARNPIESHEGEGYIPEAGGRKLIFRSAENSDVRIDVSTNATGDVILTFGIYWK